MRNLLVALLVTLASAASAAADEECVKSSDSAFRDLAARARAPRRLGDRRAAPLDLAEVETFQVQRLTPRTVEKVLADRSPEVKYCWDRTMVRRRPASGEVTLRFVVEPKGVVSTIRVEAPGLGAAFERCVVRAARRWKFPAADGETEVEYPIVFDLGGTGGPLGE